MLGHLSRPWIGNWVARNKKWIAKTDQTSILLVVYSAFSEAVVNGIWHKVGWGSLLFIVVVSLILLAIVIATTSLSPVNAASQSRRNHYCLLRFEKPANGIPMANILFPTSVLGMMVLPLMIFHQIQLMVCAGLARRYKRQTEKLQAQQAPRRESLKGVSGAVPVASALGFNQQRDLHQLPSLPAGN